MWRYRVFRVFEKLRGDKGFQGVQRPVSSCSFGHSPSFRGSIHHPKPLFDWPSPCCPASYPFLLLLIAPSRIFAVSPAHFASYTPRPYIRFEALVHGFISRLYAPPRAQPFARYPRFRLPTAFITHFRHFYHNSSPVDRAPIAYGAFQPLFPPLSNRLVRVQIRLHAPSLSLVFAISTHFRHVRHISLSSPPILVNPISILKPSFAAFYPSTPHRFPCSHYRAFRRFHRFSYLPVLGGSPGTRDVRETLYWRSSFYRLT